MLKKTEDLFQQNNVKARQHATRMQAAPLTYLAKITMK